MPEPAQPRTKVADRMASWRERIDGVLDDTLARQPVAEPRLQLAMRHAVLLGGKRMRPLLVYATGSAFGAEDATLDAPAAAVELIHAYSLVHDDLPAMDDDALRRGQPTVHVAFDEATAILAGDALQSLAFTVLADADIDAAVRIGMLAELAAAAGAQGMCGGQALDLAATDGGGTERDEVGDRADRPDGAALAASLEQLHALKTGALLRAAVRLGAMAAAADAASLARLDIFADALGLAFQIRDDLLDIEGSDATLGKTAGKDAMQGKATFPSVLGVDASRARLATLAETMRDALSPFGRRGEALAVLGQRAIDRNH